MLADTQSAQKAAAQFPERGGKAGGDPPPEVHKAAQAAGISAQKTRRRARSYLQISGGSQDEKTHKQTRRRVKKSIDNITPAAGSSAVSQNLLII